jgi:hypothetical protein
MAKTDTWRGLLRDTYFSVDRRTLGLARIAIGFLLTMDMLRRAPDWLAMFSLKGVLPSPVILARPQSDGFTFFTAFNTPGELWCLWAVGLLIALCMLAGYRTKIAQIAALAYWVSMNGRVLLIENGGYVVQNLLLLWTLFMPLGDRFSVDALRASFRRERERTAADLNDRSHVLTERQATPHVSLAMFAVLLQISALYFFNVVHKTGPVWSDGTAVHYVLYNDRMITPLLANVRDYAPFWLIQLLTRGTLAIEAGLVLLLLSPLARVWCRRGVVAGMCLLHLGFGMSFQLGPFAWSCCTFSTLMIASEDWDLAARTMRRTERARTVLYHPRSGAALWLCRLLKRLDRYELLTFEEASVKKAGSAASKQAADTSQQATPWLVVVRPGGARVERSAALADIVAALPMGPVFAWTLRLPGVRDLVDALIASAERRHASAWLGLPPATLQDRAAEAGPVALRSRAARLALGTFREVLVLAMLAGAVSQASVELWVFRRYNIPQPTALRVLSHTGRFMQGWFMFSPNPLMDDGTIVVDAITVDGRHIDPFTGKEPYFDLPNARSLRLNQIWGDYFNRIRLPANTFYRDAMKDYMLRLPERTGNPNDTIVSGDVYWVQDQNPPIGQTRSYRYERQKLFSFTGPAPRVGALAPTAPSRLADRNGG